jgi:hypothetical protein
MRRRPDVPHRRRRATFPPARVLSRRRLPLRPLGKQVLGYVYSQVPVPGDVPQDPGELVALLPRQVLDVVQVLLVHRVGAHII